MNLWLVALACVSFGLGAAWPELNEAGERIGWAWYRITMRSRQRRACGVCQESDADRDRRIAQIMVFSGMVTPGSYALFKIMDEAGWITYPPSQPGVVRCSPGCWCKGSLYCTRALDSRMYYG